MVDHQLLATCLMVLTYLGILFQQLSDPAIQEMHPAGLGWQKRPHQVVPLEACGSLLT